MERKRERGGEKKETGLTEAHLLRACRKAGSLQSCNSVPPILLWNHSVRKQTYGKILTAFLNHNS